MPRRSNKRKNTRASLILIPFSSSDWVLCLKESSWWLDLHNLPVNHGNLLLQSLVLVDTIYLQSHLKKRSSAGVGIMLNGAGFPHLMSSRTSVEDLMDRNAVHQQVLVVCRLSSTICASCSAVTFCPHELVPKDGNYKSLALWQLRFFITHDFSKHCYGELNWNSDLLSPVSSGFAAEKNCFDNPCGKLNKLPVIAVGVLNFLVLI